MREIVDFYRVHILTRRVEEFKRRENGVNMFLLYCFYIISIFLMIDFDPYNLINILFFYYKTSLSHFLSYPLIVY